MSSTTTQRFSLTSHLLSLDADAYRAATQAPFLSAAAEGRLTKAVLGRWLANDRMYIHSYIKAAARLLSSVDLPQTWAIVPVPVPEPPTDGDVAQPNKQQQQQAGIKVSALNDSEQAAETKLVDWLVEALVAVRKEERMFLDVAERYGLGPVDLGSAGGDHGAKAAAEHDGGGAAAGPGDLLRLVTIPEDQKLPGLTMIEALFGSVATSKPAAGAETSLASRGVTTSLRARALLPWLEGAVLFWATERCYLDAWSWAKAQQALASATGGGRGPTAEHDADGGALRREFIPNWSSAEFAQFVARLGGIVDFAVARELDRAADPEATKLELLGRVEGRWKSLLAAEASFWPEV